MARTLGTRPWLMRHADLIVRLDHRLHTLSGGRFGLVALAGLPSVRLTTTGRRSGLARTANLLCLPRGEELVLIGSNWGRRHDPAWTHNLRARPAATVRRGRRVLPARAREVDGAEYNRLWAELQEFWPGYEMERKAAERRLPIFVLTVPGGCLPQ
ncbi:nitroreductase/quinone reductase family protein [Amycolatopsis cihanbeyliensis]